jgi:hypothetical protein
VVGEGHGAQRPGVLEMAAGGGSRGYAVRVAVPIRTGRGLNAREHHYARAKRVKAERNAVGWLLNVKTAPGGPVRVLLTRVAPSAGLDDDNLQGALKAVRDAVAVWLGRDDADKSIAWTYAQRRGAWGVEIEVLA